MPPGKRFENWVVNKVLSRWQKLWSRQRRKKKTCTTGATCKCQKCKLLGGSGGMAHGKSVEIWAS